MRTFYRVVILLLPLSLGTLPAHGQGRGQGRGQGLPIETLHTTATVKGVSPRMLQVVAEDGKEWLVSLPTEYENLVFQATATPDWLRPGMTVRFNATIAIQKRKKEITLKEPITALTVATVRPDVGIGIFPENETNQLNDLFGGGKAEAKKRRASSELVETPCLIIGRLVENKDGKLRIAAGRVPVRAELSDKAEVSVELHDVMWVRPEDKAEITARYSPARMGEAEGQQMTITAAKPLTGKEGVEKHRRRANRGQEADESAPEKGKGKEKDKDD